MRLSFVGPPTGPLPAVRGTVKDTSPRRLLTTGPEPENRGSGVDPGTVVAHFPQRQALARGEVGGEPAVAT